MGLDIVAYSTLRKLDCLFDKEGDPVDPATRNRIDAPWIQIHKGDFDDRADELEEGEVYSFQKSSHFHAGSYSEYNRWRRALAEMAGTRQNALCPGEAFGKLVYFSDCEGVLGSQTCKEMIPDFEKYDAKAQEIGSYFYKTYKAFHQAMIMAANGGCIRFC